jgi:hypothetical protein
MFLAHFILAPLNILQSGPLDMTLTTTSLSQHSGHAVKEFIMSNAETIRLLTVIEGRLSNIEMEVSMLVDIRDLLDEILTVLQRK